MTRSVVVNGVEWHEGVYSLREPFVHAKPDRRRTHGWRAPGGYPAGHQFKIHVRPAGDLPFDLDEGRPMPAYVEIRTDAGEYHRLYDGAARAVDPVWDEHVRAVTGEHPSEVVRLLALLERVRSPERDVADALGLMDPSDVDDIAVRVLANLVRGGTVSVEYIRAITAHIEERDDAEREAARAAKGA